MADFKWEVTYNTKHGQPGPLAYKVDTLIINRLIDALGRPLPELIRIGSLSEVCRSLGTQDTGPNIASLRAAFLQNASAFINAKIRYKLKNGREKWGEMGYTRYSVVFTGETLPDGRQADAVHIILNPPYRDLLNHVETRPLDYDYLKQLPPGSQRFYELLSFQIYGAIASGRPRAKMVYSDYCKYAPQVRYLDFDHVKKQMYKIHLLHRESGYIAQVDYKSVVDTENKADWEVFYTPGPKAFAEYEAFTNRQAKTSSETVKDSAPPNRRKASLQTTLDLALTDPTLIEELTRRGITEKMARELLSKVIPRQDVIGQLEYVDTLIAKDRRGKLNNPPGLYIYHLRENIAPPRKHLPERQTSSERNSFQAADDKSSAGLEKLAQYEDYRVTEVKRFIRERVSTEEYGTLLKQHRRRNKILFKRMSATQLDAVTERSVIGELTESGRVQLMSFEEFNGVQG